MHFRSLLIYGCFGVQFVVLALVVRREYYQPYVADPSGRKMKRLRFVCYAVSLVPWIAIGIAQSFR